MPLDAGTVLKSIVPDHSCGCASSFDFECTGVGGWQIALGAVCVNKNRVAICAYSFVRNLKNYCDAVRSSRLCKQKERDSVIKPAVCTRHPGRSQQEAHESLVMLKREYATCISLLMTMR